MGYFALLFAGLIFTIITAGIAAVIEERGKPAWAKKETFYDNLLSIACWLLLAKDKIPIIKDISLSDKSDFFIAFIGFILYVCAIAPGAVWVIAKGLNGIA